MGVLAVFARSRAACLKRTLPGIWLVLSLALLLDTGSLRAQSASKEYQIKAAFLYNFFQFVEWPPESFSQPQAPLVIGIIGDDPFGGSLDEIVRGEKVNGRPMVIQHYHSPGEIKACHVLFVSRSAGGDVKEILSGLKGRNILTVSDIDDFTRDGGIIRFFTENNKIRFKINVDAAKIANLRLSSKLLSAAEKD